MSSKFEPCSDCPFDAKTREDCGICTDTGDDYYLYNSLNGDYSPSQPWNAPGMSINDFIR